MIGIVVK